MPTKKATTFGKDDNPPPPYKTPAKPQNTPPPLPLPISLPSPTSKRTILQFKILPMPILLQITTQYFFLGPVGHIFYSSPFINKYALTYTGTL